MVGYRLFNLTKDEAIYEYYPMDDRSSIGLVGYNRKNNEWLKLESANNDADYYYGSHMWPTLESFQKNGHFETSGVVVWQ